ncbi:MAG: hypothetical protein ACYC2H_08395 [Thermoplasmatota archaeon]
MGDARRPLRYAFVVAVALACTAPSASAQPPTIDFAGKVDVEGAARFTGRFEGAAEVVGLLADTRLATEPARLHAVADQARYVAVDFPAMRFVRNDGGPADNSTVHLPSRTVSNGTLSGLLKADVPETAYSYRILPAVAGFWSMPWKVEGTAAFARPLDQGQTFLAEDGWVTPGQPVPWPEGPATTTRWPGVPVPSGSYRIILHGGNVSLGGQTIATGESTTATKPLDGAAIYEVHDVVLFIEGSWSSIDPEGAGWHGALRGLTGAFGGDLELEAAMTDLRVDGQPVRGDFALLQVQGSGVWDMRLGDQRREWTLEGDARFVGLDGRTFAGTRSLAGPIAAATAAGLLVVGVAWATHLGREAITFVTGYNIARPLESEARVRMLRTIGAEPGITRMQLVERLSLSRTAVLHHLDVLARARLIDPHRAGKIPSYFLNHASFRFAPSDGNGAANPKAVDILSKLSHPLRRLILANLQAGRLDVSQLQARLVASGHRTPRETLAYHLRILEKGGVVLRLANKPAPLYKAAIDLATIRQHQLRALVTVEGLRPALQAVLSGRNPPARELNRLLAYGLVDRAAAGAYQLAPGMQDLLGVAPTRQGRYPKSKSGATA